jgi:hypothetical protein
VLDTYNMSSNPTTGPTLATLPCPKNQEDKNNHSLDSFAAASKQFLVPLTAGSL